MTRHCHVLYAFPDAVTAVWNALRLAAPKRREEEEEEEEEEAGGKEGGRGWRE
jgi:hypothetical protein